jgi:hypothetical protein
MMTYNKLNCKFGPPAEKVITLKQITSIIKIKMSCLLICNGTIFSKKAENIKADITNQSVEI